MNNAIKKALVAGKHPKGSIQTGQANHTTGSGYSKNYRFNPSTISRNFTKNIISIPKRQWLVFFKILLITEEPVSQQSNLES